MSVARGLVIILACGLCFGLAGGLLGFALGAGAPAYYRGVFDGGNDPGFRPVQVGLGLGLTQGAICGLVIGSVIVLATGRSRRPDAESRPTAQPGDSKRPRSPWVRRAFAMVFVLAAVACSGLIGFVVGAIVVQVQQYHRSAEARLARVRPVLGERPFAGVQAEPTSDGKVDLFGTVASEQEYKALQDRMRFLFGDEDARAMTGASRSPSDDYPTSSYLRRVGRTMKVRTGLMAALGLSAILPTMAPARGGDEKTPVSWKKTVIEGTFRSEGVAIADVDKDGKLDVLIGDSWYHAPSWAKHDIRKPGNYGDGLHGYSECMTCWTDDVNGDGWADQIVIGFPGVPAYWYENPRGGMDYWPRHEIWHSACNETPLYTDLFGDGHRVLVMGWQPKGKDNEGQMAWFTPGSDPTQPWEMHPVSEPSQPGHVVPGTFKFSHGLGVGDLNGDGRRDVICTDGWWEQPESGRKGTEPWTFHPAQLGGAVADMIAYDVNGDGKADVIASSAHQYGIWWFEQGEVKDGSPVFTRHDLFPDLVSETHALIAADINRDGLVNLVTGKRFWSHGKNEPGSDKPARLYWFEASRGPDGKIAFTPREIDDQSGIGTQFVVADFNGDGLLDVVTSNKKGVFLLEQAGR